MFNGQYKKEMEQVAPSQDLINRTKAAMEAEMQSKKKQANLIPFSKRPVFRRVAAVATAAAILLFAVFGTNLFNQDGDIFPTNPFVMRAYAMELQPDGTYVRREIDITQLDGWGSHYDGETLYIGLGLWFEFEGENINTVEFSLENGFFATQYIGNRGATPNIPSFHVATGLDFTTSRLVMYGFDFDKIGDTITFDNAISNNILLFWGSHDIGYGDWLQSDMTIEIDINVTFEDGEIHNQQMVLGFQNRQGSSVGWFGAIETPLWQYWRHAPTNEQTQYLMNASLESFQLISESVMTFEREYVFSIDDYTEPIVFLMPRYFEEFLELFDENGIWRQVEGVRNGEAFILVIQHDGNEVLTGMVYVTSLQD